jgi:hypothetical protein
MIKAYRLGSNKTGKRFAIVKRGKGFIVIAEFKNYERGHTVANWRVCQQYRNQPFQEFQAMAKAGMPFSEAEKLFNKKVVKPKAEAA